MTKQTPGPWRHYSGAIVAKDRTSRSENAIVHVAKVGAFEDKELLRFNGDRWRADARLIAAAPSLYEALEAMLAEFGARLSDGKPLGHTVGSMGRALDLVRKAEAAIDRAKGLSIGTN